MVSSASDTCLGEHEVLVRPSSTGSLVSEALQLEERRSPLDGDKSTRWHHGISIYVLVPF